MFVHKLEVNSLQILMNVRMVHITVTNSAITPLVPMSVHVIVASFSEKRDVYVLVYGIYLYGNLAEQLRLYIIIYLLNVNECQNLTTHDCEQQCNNTVGSYECTCDSGFVLGEDGKSCLGMITEL